MRRILDAERSSGNAGLMQRIHCYLATFKAASTHLQVWQPVRVLCVNLRRLLIGIVSSECWIREYAWKDGASDTETG